VLKFADQTSPIVFDTSTGSRQLPPPPPLHLALDEDADGIQRPQHARNLVEDLQHMEEVRSIVAIACLDYKGWRPSNNSLLFPAITRATGFCVSRLQLLAYTSSSSHTIGA
jgi:hypothetical protein